MRQVNIKTLKAKLSQELLNLPLEITKNGKVIATILEKGSPFDVEKVVTSPKGSVHNAEEAKEKLTEIIKKKKMVKPEKTDIATDGRPVLGFTKEHQCRKKGK